MQGFREKATQMLSTTHLRTHIKQHMVVGLIALVPIAVCWWIVTWLWKVYMGLITPVGVLLQPMLPFYFSLGLLGLVILLLVVLSIYVTGVAVSTTMGAWFYNRFETIIRRVAFIYTPVKETCELLIKSLVGSGGLFSHTVLLISGDGLRVGYVSSDCAQLVAENLPETYVTVFFAHNPAPNSGNVGLHRLCDLIVTDVPPTQAMKAMGAFGLGVQELFTEYLPRK